MLQIADQSEMEAYNAQNEGVIKRGIQARFFRGAEPDTLATEGCNRNCDTQHAHLETCIVDGCARNCDLRHPHDKDCPDDCQLRHHTYACQDRHHVKAAGRPIFKEIVYLKKVIPGDTGNIIIRPLRPNDPNEFPQAWKDFQEGITRVHGTSLDLLPFLNEAQKAEFRATNCFTAEDIVNMPDGIAQKFMGIHSVKRKTADFLSATAGKLQEESEKKIAYLEKKLEEVLKKFETPKKG